MTGCQLSPILKTEASWCLAIVPHTSQFHYGQGTFTSCCVCDGGTVKRPETEWEAWNVWLSRAFVWYFPRKPIKDSCPSRWWKCGSSGGWSDGFFPQLLFQRHSLSQCPASLCKLFEFAVRTFVVWWGLLVGKFLKWKSHTLYLRVCVFVCVSLLCWCALRTVNE